jgi:CheY-like chemotaxis protein
MFLDRVHPILLLEDEPDDASFVRRALEKSQIANELIVFTTVQQAKQFIETANDARVPALAIVDLYLPNGETGLDFTGWLRQRESPASGIPVMMFSVSNAEKHRLEASALRSVTFLTKPVTEESLAAAAQALGFVVTTTVAGGHVKRVIEPR